MVSHAVNTSPLCAKEICPKVRISASQNANCEAILKIAKICRTIFLRIVTLIFKSQFHRGRDASDIKDTYMTSTI